MGLHYMKRLPGHLVKRMIKEMTDRSLLWRDGVCLDKHELDAIFRLIDVDRSGKIHMQELLETFTQHGLHLQGDNLRKFHQKFVTSCGLKEDSSYEDIEMDLDS